MNNSTPDLISLWKATQAELQSQVSPPSYGAYLAPLQLIELKDHIAKLTHPHAFILEQTEIKFNHLIKQILEKHAQQSLNLIFTVQPNSKTKPSATTDDLPLFSPKTTQQTQLHQSLHRSNLLPHFTFDNFAVGSTNQFAYAAAEAVAHQPGQAYNPLFIYGGTGVGKSHLMQAVGHAILNQKPDQKILFCPGEDFTNEIVAAIREKTTLKFKAKYRQMNALLLDDIQFLAGKDAAQEEFFHTFNAIHRAGGQIIMTADRPPTELTLLEPRLRSRFQAGLIVDVGEPGFELRTAILLIKAQLQGIDLTMEHAQQAAGSLKTARELEGFLLNLKADLMQAGSKMQDATVTDILGKQIREQHQLPAHLRPNDIIKAAADYFDLKVAQLKSDRRQARIVRARQIAQYIMRIDMNIQLQAIGEYFSRDHTTIMHSVEKLQNLLGKTPELDQQILGIKKMLRG